MLIQNAIRTPDGTILNSLTESDCITHLDSKTEFKYLIDGGLSYSRSHGDSREEELIISDTDPISVVIQKIVIKIEGSWKLAKQCTREELQTALKSKNLPPLKKHIINMLLNQ